MKRTLSIALVLALSACGGGGGGTAAVTAKSAVYTYKGTVPGTLIEAFCDNGAYYSTTSYNNGTSEHPFELELPAGLACRLVMTTNENDPANKVVTPIGFVDANGNISTSATGAAGAVIDLGNIALYMSRSDAASKDANGDGVLDAPMDLGTPTSLEIETHKTQNDTLDTDEDGIVNAYDSDYSAGSATDTDNDGLPDSVDANPTNDPNASNTYPQYMDHDGDGYLDEDANHDGYYDDDANKDGYHDDDANHDGYHDNDANHDGFPDTAAGEHYADAQGSVAAVDGTANTITLTVTGGEGIDDVAVGSDITVDTTDARFEGTSMSTLQSGDQIEVQGSWDGTVFKAYKIETRN